MNEAVSAILREAGAVLKERFRQAVCYEHKGRRDFVCDVDREIEATLISRIQAVHSCKSFYSEEAGTGGEPGDSRWILDPLDGTANFIFGVPYFSISVALECMSQIVEAYVYNPITDELFHTTRKALRSFLNAAPITVSTTSDLSDALVALGFSAVIEKIDRYHREWPHVFDRCRKGLGLLAPSLNICNVARGRIDCFIDYGSSMEGHAAAALILENAGGAARDYDGSGWDHTSKGIVATNGRLASVKPRLTR